MAKNSFESASDNIEQINQIANEIYQESIKANKAQDKAEQLANKPKGSLKLAESILKDTLPTKFADISKKIEDIKNNQKIFPGRKDVIVHPIAEGLVSKLLGTSAEKSFLEFYNQHTKDFPSFEEMLNTGLEKNDKDLVKKTTAYLYKNKIPLADPEKLAGTLHQAMKDGHQDAVKQFLGLGANLPDFDTIKNQLSKNLISDVREYQRMVNRSDQPKDAPIEISRQDLRNLQGAETRHDKALEILTVLYPDEAKKAAQSTTKDHSTALLDEIKKSQNQGNESPKSKRHSKEMEKALDEVAKEPKAKGFGDKIKGLFHKDKGGKRNSKELTVQSLPNNKASLPRKNSKGNVKGGG